MTLHKTLPRINLGLFSPNANKARRFSGTVTEHYKVKKCNTNKTLKRRTKSLSQHKQTLIEVPEVMNRTASKWYIKKPKTNPSNWSKTEINTMVIIIWIVIQIKSSGHSNIDKGSTTHIVQTETQKVHKFANGVY